MFVTYLIYNYIYLFSNLRILFLNIKRVTWSKNQNQIKMYMSLDSIPVSSIL